MSADRVRVVITGMGVVSPIGSDLGTLWASLEAGRSGISKVERLDCGSLPFDSGGEVKDFTGSIDDYGPLDKKLQRSIKKNMKVMCREIEMGVAASQKALTHSGLGEDRDPARCGCLFGCDYILTRPEEYLDGLQSCRQERGGEFSVDDWPTHGLSKVNPLWLLKYLPNMPNSHVSIYNDFRGPNNSITDRDASMNLALLEATSIIQRGAADAMLVGATGTRLHPLRTPQALMTAEVAAEQRDPSQMSRPFDAASQGMVLGEGAGTLMLESLEHAEARGAKIWGEVLSGGAAMVGPAAGGQHLAEALQIAFEKTLRGCPALPSHWHVHAQGMGMMAADQAEAVAYSRALQEFDGIPITAAKSYFGNLGAGSAAVELVCSLLALEKGALFPILNLEEPIPEVNWEYAKAGASPGEAVLHSSFTLEGQAACVLVGKY